MQNPRESRSRRTTGRFAVVRRQDFSEAAEGRHRQRHRGRSRRLSPCARARSHLGARRGRRNRREEAAVRLPGHSRSMSHLRRQRTGVGYVGCLRHSRRDVACRAMHARRTGRHELDNLAGSVGRNTYNRGRNQSMARRSHEYASRRPCTARYATEQTQTPARHAGAEYTEAMT